MNVLIIDDSKLVLEIARNILKENIYNHDVDTLNDPIGLMEQLEKKDYDLIITDLVMPNLNGIDIIHQVKENDQYSDIKVLVLTSVTSKDKLAECFEAGAADYITKPIDEIEFSARVNNAIKELSLTRALNRKIKEIEGQREKLEEANHKLKVTQANLIHSEKLAGIGQLAAGVAHEINNPLGFVISNFKTLEEYVQSYDDLIEKHESPDMSVEDLQDYKSMIGYDFIKEDISELLGDTNDGLHRIKGIVSSLRTFSKVDQFKEFADYDLNEGINETLVIAKNKYKYDCEIELALDDIPSIKAYGGEINQILLNLIVNAVDAIVEKEMDKKGIISIKTYQEGPEVILKVKDDGIGMTEEVKKDIFNPFFTTKDVDKGTGLGLSITQDIIMNKHNGSITVDSVKGEYTEFTIKLPIDQVEEEE